jgi:hypothetical protein
MIDHASGNITLHRAADEKIELVWFDDAGEELDISTADIRFIVEKGFTLVPDLDPNNPLGRNLHFTEAHALSLGNYVSNYVLLLSNGNEDTPLMEGTIKAAGFAV